MKQWLIIYGSVQPFFFTFVNYWWDFYLQAHKTVLAVASPVFKIMFNQLDMTSPMPIIDLDYKAFRGLIE